MASALPQIIQTKTINIDSVSWTPISAPMDCNELYILIGGAASVKIRTDSADPNTEKTVSAGAEYDPIDGGWVSSGFKPRFPSGVTCLYAQATSGTGPLVVTGLL